MVNEQYSSANERTYDSKVCARSDESELCLELFNPEVIKYDLLCRDCTY